MMFQQFIEQGYLILKQDCLKALVEPSELEIFHHNIVSFREGMRSFFERPAQERQLFESGDYVFRISGHRPGYWPQGVYKDIYEKKQFSVEYFYSRNLYAAKRNSLFVPENNFNLESLAEVEKLPHSQGYDIVQFTDRHVIFPLTEELKSYSQPHSLLDYILQITPVYYRGKARLNIHRDKSFIQSVIGPASGLIVQPDRATKPQQVTLDTGEMLLYAGLQFKEYFKEDINSSVKAKPLPHGVISDEEKRMSIVVITMVQS